MARSRRSFLSFGGLSIVTVGAALLIALANPWQTSATDANLDNATSELEKLTQVLDDLGQVGDLSDLLPLSGVDPAEALGLADIFDDEAPGDIDSLKDELAALAPNDAADLETKLDELDFDAGGVHVEISGPGADTANAPQDTDDGKPTVTQGADDVVDIQLTVTATRTFDMPIDFATDVINLVGGTSGGEFPIEFALQTSTLHFRFDPAVFANAATVNQAFSLLTTPTPTISLTASSTDASLSSLLGASLGFTSVGVTGNLSFDVDYAFELRDPDAAGGGAGDGKITADELTGTTVGDLVIGGLVDDGATNAVDVEITLDSNLTGVGADLTITYVDPSLTVTGDEVGPSFDQSADILQLRNFTATDALGAVARLISLLDGLQATGALDIDLPFVNGLDDPNDPNDSPHGSFSDALRVAERLVNAFSDQESGPDPDVDLTQINPDTDIAEPAFANAQTMASKLEDALGLADGTVDVTFDAVNQRLEFGLDVSGSRGGEVALNIGDIDILAGIQLDSDGAIDIEAAYGLDLDFALDLRPQPTEDGAGIGSCSDGVDNGPEDDDPGTTEDDPPQADNPATPVDESDLRDAVDPDCVTAETLEQRVQFKVGTEDDDPDPELEASLGVSAANVDAGARVGILDVRIADAHLAVAGATGEDGSSDVATCADGSDNGTDGDTDAEDPDCRAALVVDLVDDAPGGDGWLTVRELFDALGRHQGEDVDLVTGGVQPAPAYLEAQLDASVDVRVPVNADLLPDVNPGGELGSGFVAAEGSFSGQLAGADGSLDPSKLLENVSVSSDFSTADLDAFSPCANTVDDDGDGTVNDGCGNIDAVDESEASTLAMFDKVVDLIRAVAQQLEASGVFPAGTLDEEIPLLGISFNDLVAFADSLAATADATENAAESSIPGACSNANDDDGDGVDNDGCPTVGELPEADCVDLAPGPDDDDGDLVVNDGCQPEVPSLQELADALAPALGRVLDNIDTATDNPNDVSDATVAASLTYDPTANDLTFDLDIDPFTYTLPVPFSVDLPEAIGNLVALSAVGDVDVTVNGALHLGVGLDFDEFDDPANLFFVKGESALDLSAEAVGQELVFTAGVGSIQVQIGQNPNQATGENTIAGACDAGNTADEDADGFANDGCPAVPDPETGTECGNKVDDDSDEAADDGCGDDNPDTAGSRAETGAECVDTNGEENDDMVGDPPAADDAVADDGCPDDPAATAQAPDNDPEGGAADPACAAGNVADEDTDGTANDGCPARADQGRFAVGLAASLDVGTAGGDDDTRYTLSTLSFDGDITGTDPDLCTPVDISTPNSGPAAPAGTPKDACAVLPLYFDNGTTLVPIGTPPNHQIRTAITDFETFTFDDPFNNTTGFSFQYDVDQLATFIQGELINFLLLNSGIDQLLALLEDLLESDLLSFALPLIGGQTATAAGIVDDLRASIADGLADAVTNPGENPLGTLGAAAQVRTFVTNVKDAIIGLLPDNVATVVDPTVRILCGETPAACDTGAENDPTNAAATGGAGQDSYCADGGGGLTGNGVDDDGDGTVDDGCPGGANAVEEDEATAVSDIEFRFSFEGTVDLLDLDNPLAFDIGIPGLSLSGGFQPSGEVEWRFAFGFGINKNDGFYFITDNDPVPDGDPDDDSPEVEVDLNVTLSPAEGQDPSNITGEFGFLQVTLEDETLDAGEDCNPDGGFTNNACPSFISGEFSVDVLDPDGNGKMTFSELSNVPSFAQLIQFGLGATAEVNLAIATSIAGLAELPQITGNLALSWAWTLSDEDDSDALAPGTGSGLTIELLDLQLDAGTFISKFLQPVFKDVKRFTEPFQPIIDALNACIPVISDLSGSCTSLLDIALSLAPQEYDFIIYVVQLIDFVNSLDTESPTLRIDITGPDGNNDFTLAGPTLQGGILAPTEAQQAYAENINGAPNLLDDINAAKGNEGSSELKVSGLAGIGVTFPFLEQPTKLLGLLFGQDVDLVVWEPPPVSIGFSYSQKFGPIWSVPPVFLELGGSVSVTGTFGIGYSTKGFRNIVFNSGGPDALLQGLFLLDKHPYSALPGGDDINELELRGEIFANAQVSVLIFSAGAQGSVFLTIGIDLQDPNGDGRLEYDEAADIIRTTGNVLCIFNLNGQFGVRISVFAEVDLFFWSQRWDFTLAEIIIYEFKVECEPLPDPVLAHAQTVGDQTQLILHVGDVNRHLRDPEEFAAPPYIVEPGFDDSDFTNQPDGDANNSVGFDVTAENWLVTIEENGDMTVAALGVTQRYAGPFDIVIGDASDAAAPIDDGENLIDVITLADGKPSTGSALVPFNVPSDLSGGSGNDEFTGGRANDELDGGDGDDTLTGKDGAKNTISGGAGADVINSGTGDDDISGGSGDDSISAGLGIDKIVGGPDHDTIDGGRSVPKTPDGGDTIWGDNEDGTGTGNDTIDSGDGNDIVHAGAGKDRVDAGNGTDTVDDGGTAEAAADTCTTASGSADDPLTGEDDVFVGGPGVDSLTGAAGDDILIGGNVLAGGLDEGDSKLDGGIGCDWLFGDNVVLGDGGPRDISPIDDTIGGAETNMTGGDGGDRLYGQKGNDVMTGNAGADLMWGLHDSDVMDGGTGDDKLWGDVNPAGLLTGAEGNDDMAGGDDDDVLFGDGGADYILGDIGSVNRPAVTLDGGQGKDELHGGAGNDFLFGQGNVTSEGREQVFGDSGEDTAYGDGNDSAHDDLDGNDLVRGGIGNDYVFGNNGADDVFGDSGNDRMVGGNPNSTSDDSGTVDDEHTSADQFGDHMYGGTGNDVMAGDNATITPAGATTLLAESTIGQADLMLGEANDDTMFGENDADHMFGGTGDDHAEGGDNDDTIRGEDGQDDLIGGTTEPADGFVAGHQPDTGDDIRGGNGHDVIAGDNAKITRLGLFDDLDPGRGVSDVERRVVELFDVATLASQSADVGFSGAETIFGDDGYDIIYGQGGGDTLHGGLKDDYLEGNNAIDTIYGEHGQDDIIGGTGRTKSDDPTTAVDGRLDDADDLFGGDGAGGVPAGDDFDVIMGDNATILRPDDPDLAGTQWDVNAFNASIKRNVFLYDVATLTNAVDEDTHGAETMFGENDADLMYGQGDGDTMEGGHGDDYMEGNDGADTIKGQIGNDDVAGGTGRINFDPPEGVDGRLDLGEVLIQGGPGFDWIAGDNAIIRRVLDADGQWVPSTFNGGFDHELIRLRDVAIISALTKDVATSGGDTIEGNEDDDVLYGQGNNGLNGYPNVGTGVHDLMHGNAGHDYMEGNAGGDRMFGDDDQDDMLGGTGRLDGDPVGGTPGRADMGDYLYGNLSHDTILGDNAVLTRPLDGSGHWMAQVYDHVFDDVVDAPDQSRTIRTIVNIDHAFGVTSGSDVVHGQEGDDELYGQLDDTLGPFTDHGGTPSRVQENCDGGALLMPNDPFWTGEPLGTVPVAGDLLCGGVGEDAILGDQGVITSFVESNLTVTITHNGAPFITELSRWQNSLTRKVILQDITLGGEDVLLGDDPTNRVADGVIPDGHGAHDSLHAGAGNDIANGGQGDDFLFGDDGADAMWGGDHDDHSWGGYEGDWLDVLPRTVEETGAAADDPITWFFFGNDDPDTVDNPATEAREAYDGYRGFDISYGGWGQDAMQANEGDNGPVEGDRLVDWAGTYNAYYLCPATYGEYVSTRQMSPSLLTYLQNQAEADGATDVLGGPRETDSGFDELALVYKPDLRNNTNPVHPDTPAHFTCR